VSISRKTSGQDENAAGYATPVARCLTYVAAGRAEIRDVEATLCTDGHDNVRCSALYSGISRGTERLVFNGLVPESEYGRMRGPFQRGDFPFPVGYGYSWVGVADGSDAPCFALFPHQDVVIAPRDALVALPSGMDPRRAILAANMETALNICWDAAMGPGDRIAIVGGGVLGMLVAGIASDIPGAMVTVVDIVPERRVVAESMGAGFSCPDAATGDCDVVVHTSASQAGLATALFLAGDEARVVEASWFGSSQPAVPLGGAFHSRRLMLISSQVGMISPARRARWSHRRRLKAALDLLLDEKYDALVTGEVTFEALPEEIPRILDPASAGFATAVSYV
jgi:hypothetical protein